MSKRKKHYAKMALNNRILSPDYGTIPKPALADWERPVWDGPSNWKKPAAEPLPGLNTENAGE
jgi:hypothetical protein